MNNFEDIDKIKRLAVIGMFSDDDLMNRLVLKGGNLLDLIYKISTRASWDVDFSIDGDFEESLDVLRQKIEKGLRSSFIDEGFVVFDVFVEDVPPKITEDLKPFWGGYKIEFKIIKKEKFQDLHSNWESLRRNAISVGQRGSTKFKIDISKHEYCEGKRREEFDGYVIFTYTPEMVVCEKLRAICQQMPEYAELVKNRRSGRSRDFLDIYAVCEHFNIEMDDARFHNLLKQIFSIKKVPLKLLNNLSAHRDYHAQDFVAVKDTIKPGVKIRDFDYYFDYVLRKCESLKSLWDE